MSVIAHAAAILAANPSPLDDWSGDIGDQYFKRNPVTDDGLGVRAQWLRKVLAKLNPQPNSILEVGAGQGENLVVLRKALPFSYLAATEPNQTARDAIKAANIQCVTTACPIQRIGFDSNNFNLVFTSGCLIHVPPEERKQALSELFRVSNRWILMCEYFAAKDEHVPWRGSHIWKCDFGAEMLALYPGLLTMACEFEWKHTTGMDHATWWLFSKANIA